MNDTGSNTARGPEPTVEELERELARIAADVERLKRALAVKRAGAREAAPIEVTETDRAAARAAARDLGLLVRERKG